MLPLLAPAITRGSRLAVRHEPRQGFTQACAFSIDHYREQEKRQPFPRDRIAGHDSLGNHAPSPQPSRRAQLHRLANAHRLCAVHSRPCKLPVAKAGFDARRTPTTPSVSRRSRQARRDRRRLKGPSKRGDRLLETTPRSLPAPGRAPRAGGPQPPAVSAGPARGECPQPTPPSAWH